MAGWITSTGGDWEKYIGTMPSLTEEQAAVGTPLSEYLTEMLKGIGTTPSFEQWSKDNLPSGFGGDFYSQIMSEIGEYPSFEDWMGKMPSAIPPELSDYYKKALEGGEAPSFEDWMSKMPSMPEMPEELAEYYKKAMAGGQVSMPEMPEELAEYYKKILGGAGKPAMFGGPLAGEVKGAYAEALSGEFPEEYYQKSIRDPAMAEFREDIMPAIKESYVGTGAITGTEVGERMAKEAGKLGKGLAGIRAELGYKAKQRQDVAAQAYQSSYTELTRIGTQEAMNAANSMQSQYSDMLRYHAEMTGIGTQKAMQAASGMQQYYTNIQQQLTERIKVAGNLYTQGKTLEAQQAINAANNIQQQYGSLMLKAADLYMTGKQTSYDAALKAAELAQKEYMDTLKIGYDEYTRKYPAMTEILQSALNYLNIPMMAAYQKPESEESGVWGTSTQ